MIDDFVRTHGQDITISRVTVPVYDSNDELNEAGSTIVTEIVKAVVSQKTRGWEWTDGGRVLQPSLVITVPSTTDLRADRAGRADRVTIDGVTYEVRETRASTHPIVGTVTKLSASLQPLPGR